MIFLSTQRMLCILPLTYAKELLMFAMKHQLGRPYIPGHW